MSIKSMSPFPVEASAHAASVIFSDTALLSVTDGCVHLTFRIAKRWVGFVGDWVRKRVSFVRPVLCAGLASRYLKVGVSLSDCESHAIIFEPPVRLIVLDDFLAVH